MTPLLRTAVAALLTLSGGLACAQATGSTGGEMAVPVWNSQNGKLEAVLLIENANTEATRLGHAGRTSGLGLRWRGEDAALNAGVSLGATTGLGLLCQAEEQNVALDSACLVTQLPGTHAPSSARLQAEAGVQLGRGSISALAGRTQGSAESLLGLGTAMSVVGTPPGLRTSSVEQHDIGIVGELRLGERGWVRVGGTVSRARLVSATQWLPGGQAPRQWTGQAFNLAGGYGPLGGEIVGRVVNLPGQQRLGMLGLGLTWRTPWRGRLTVGAENLIRRGADPANGAAANSREEGRMPYVRYQQDL